MGQKKIRPVTPGMRGQVSGDFKEITKVELPQDIVVGDTKESTEL